MRTFPRVGADKSGAPAQYRPVEAFPRGAAGAMIGKSMAAGGARSTAWSKRVLFLGAAVLLSANAAYFVIAVPFPLLLTCNLGFGIWVVRKALREDLFHPVAWVVGSLLLRVFLPATLLATGLVVQDRLPLLHDPGGVHWRMGSALAGVAMTTFALGWLIGPRLRARWPGFLSRGTAGAPGLRLAVYVGAGAGITAYAVFFLSNWGTAGSIEVLAQGLLRAGGREGTSRFSYLGFHFLAWSVWLAALLRYRRKGKIPYALIPSVLVAILLLPFGGRVNALQVIVVPLAALWYLRSSRHPGPAKSRRTRRWVLGLSLLVVFWLALAPVVRSYRGGGVQNAAGVLSPRQILGDEILFWGEGNILHVYSSAILVGAGSYQPPLLRFLFEGYLGHFLGLTEAPAHGEFLVHGIQGGAERPGWGLHTGAPIDFYLSFGLGITILGMLVLGGVWRAFYAGVTGSRQRSDLVFLVYSYVFWYLYWFVFERGMGFFTWLEGVIFLLPFVFAGKLMGVRASR